MVSRVLPRPRDLVFFTNAAIETAVGRGHALVEEDDVIKAEDAYSQFAFEALQVENGLDDSEFFSVFYEFAGMPAVVERDELDGAFERANIAADEVELFLERLLELSFLGMETRDQEFEYFEQSSDTTRTRVLAGKLAESRDAEARYSIHPAYRAYLEVLEPM
jgi:hypothetical protein